LIDDGACSDERTEREMQKIETEKEKLGWFPVVVTIAIVIDWLIG
jgi:hypothetical protein